MEGMKKHRRWLIPLLILLILTPFAPYLDIAISSYFYHPDTGQFTNSPFLQFVYDYAQLPAFFIAGCTGILLVATFVIESWKKYRTPSLIIVLAMLIGPGLLINGILKPSWGRPRPRQIVELGGTVPYAPFYAPNILPHKGDRYKSFPSGHAAMGFYFLVLVVLGLRLGSPILLAFGVSLTALLGGLLGFTRIAQGGHFFTDVLFSALFAWLIAITLDWLFFSDEKPDQKTV